MANINFTTGQTAKKLGGSDNVWLMENVIDFSKVNLASDDTAQVLQIGAGIHVMNVFTKLLTVEGSANSLSIGDDDNGTSWDGTVNLNTTVDTYTNSINGTDAYAAAGKTYTVDDTIDLEPTGNATIDTAKLKIWAHCLDLRT